VGGILGESSPAEVEARSGILYTCESQLNMRGENDESKNKLHLGLAGKKKKRMRSSSWNMVSLCLSSQRQDMDPVATSHQSR